MARPKKIAEFDFEPPSQEELDFETFLDEVGPGTAVIEVFRYKRDGTRGQLDRVGIDVLREDVYGFLRESYGPGKYWLVFKGSDRKYKGSKILIVDDPRVKTDDSRPAASNSGDPLMRDLLLAMVAAQKPIPPPPPPDIGAMMTGLASMLVAMKPASAPDATSMLTAVATVFSTLRGPQKDEDWLERAKVIIGLAKDLQPDSNKEENFWSVAKDVGKEVITRLQIGPARAAGANGVAPMVHAGAPMTATITNTAQPAPQPEQQMGATFEQWLKAGIEYLRDKALRGKGVDWMIDRVLEDAEEPQWAAVIEAIRKGATFENLLQFEPSIGQNPQLTGWFKALYDGLYAEIHKSVDSAGTGRHEGDASKNAGTGTTGEPDAGS